MFILFIAHQFVSLRGHFLWCERTTRVGHTPSPSAPKPLPGSSEFHRPAQQTLQSNDHQLFCGMLFKKFKLVENRILPRSAE